MQLVFPHIELLQYCLQSGVIPKHVSSSKVSAGALLERPLVVAPARKPSKKTLEQLKNLGVETTAGEQLDEQFNSWFELLPLEPDDTEASEFCRGTIVFQLMRRERLADLIAELLRLGNDRIGLRYSKIGKSIIAFARVEKPPFYSVLRAIEHAAENACEDSPTIVAFREQAPRVWVQVGYRYPLADLLQPTETTEILFRHGRRMRFFEHAPYSDIYQSIDVAASQNLLPASAVEQRFEIPLRLLDADPTDATTLWLLQKDPVEQIESLLIATGDRYIDQLSFASIELDGSLAVVLRAKRTRSTTLVVTPDGIGFHSYMKLPQLYVPNGMRLSPPMRRDFVANLFVPEGDHITLLLPNESTQHASDQTGGFVACRVAEDGFRPLRNWSDFVLEREIQTLEEWTERHTFDFEEFVTEIDPAQQAPLKPPIKQRKTKARAKPTPSSSARRTPENRPTSQPDFEPLDDSPTTVVLPANRIPDDWDVVIDDLESEFKALSEPVDGPSRAALWTQLGNAYLRRNRQRDGTVCFSNALWLTKSSSEADSNELSQRWLEAEVHCADVQVDDDSTLDSLVAQNVSPSIVVAYLNQLANQNSDVSTQSVSVASQFLRDNETVLPIRTTWIGWSALSKLSGGDSLMLAQARDRLLRQLHESGLRADFDLPGFLRLSGRADASRRGHIEEGIDSLQEKAEQWIIEPDSILHDSIRATRQYAQLTFAYAYAKIGQSEKAREVMTGAIADLPDDSEVHRWLAAAYQERIENTIHGRDDSWLSAGLLDAIGELPKYDANVVNQIRAISRIIDPDILMDDLFWRDQEGLKAYQRQLFQTADPILLREQVELLEQEVRGDPQNEAETFVTILAVAPRLDASTATRILSRVSGIVDKATGNDWPKCATLLERGICVAGHFGILPLVRQFKETLQKLLPELVHATISSASVRGQGRETNKIKLFHESYSKMRRLGLDDELRQLLRTAWTAVGKFKPPKKRPGANPEGSQARSLGIKLHVATGWQYLGDSERTDEVLNEAQELIFKSPLDMVSRTELIRNYAFLIGNCQIDAHIDRLVELLEYRSDNRRKIDHNKPFVDESIISARLCSKQFQVIEAVVLGLLGECTLNPESQKLLDEEEFLVRKKIHQDVESLV